MLYEVITILDTAYRRVFALDILTHDDEVYVARLFPGQGARDAVEQPYRTKIDVLVEFSYNFV